ncbi:MAG: UDP-2,3-diacylglucosamine diphosphatase [Gammaproteobacteria bacterium]
MVQQTVRSVFISDVHLGTADCQAQYLLDFLKSHRMQFLYLVGDIVDLLYMRKRVNFTALHEEVVNQIVRLASQGTRVIYIPGNHDAKFRRYCGQSFAGIEIERYWVHECADGRRFFVSHGDEFDGAMHAGPLWTLVGDLSHTLLLRLNTLVNAWRRLLKKPYWSLAGYIKTRIGKAAEFIRRFEWIAAHKARELQYDGYICGHIHVSGMRRIDGVLYCNDGDWVEHCTALVEDSSGQLSLVHWADRKEVLIREHELTESWDPLPQAH